MKISYVYHSDAGHPGVQSGRPAAILEALENSGCEVQRIFPLRNDYRARCLLQKVLWHAAGRRYLVDRHPALLRSYARQVEEALEQESGDVLFSPGTLTLGDLETDLPVTFCSDASLASLLDYYPSYSRLSPFLRRTAEQGEAAAMSKAALAIYPSEWAAQAAQKSYSLPARKVAVVPFGANLGGRNTEADVTEWIDGRAFKTIQLLFIGREWERKGGALVVEAARLLTQRGMAVQLNVVGPKWVPVECQYPFVKDHGPLNPADPDERVRLAALFREAHLLFVPSRAEAFGLVFAEASAFGVPSIATDTGGIPGVIREGMNGHLLPLRADAEAFADLVEGTVGDPNRYRALAWNSFEEFRKRLNWEVFCQRYFALVRERVFNRPADSRSGLHQPSSFVL